MQESSRLEQMHFDFLVKNLVKDKFYFVILSYLRSLIIGLILIYPFCVTVWQSMRQFYVRHPNVPMRGWLKY